MRLAESWVLQIFDQRLGFPSPSLNVVIDYFSHSCLKLCKICLKRTLDATFLDCLALTFCDVIGELPPEWACLTLQGGTTFLLTSNWRIKRIFHGVMVRIGKVEPEGWPGRSGPSFSEVQITCLPEGSTFPILTNDPVIDYFSCLSTLRGLPTTTSIFLQVQFSTFLHMFIVDMHSTCI